MELNIAIIYGSVRASRQGIKAARFIEKKCLQRGWQTTLIDPLEYNLPLLDKMYKEYEPGQAPAMMTKLGNILKRADAYIIISGEYNHSLPPALTNILDHFMEEYFFKPSAIVSYSAGPFGGLRAAVHLRALLGEIGTVSIPSMFPITKVQDSFDNGGNALDKNYDRRVKKFLDELAWYAQALKSARAKNTPY